MKGDLAFICAGFEELLQNFGRYLEMQAFFGGVRGSSKATARMRRAVLICAVQSL